MKNYKLDTYAKDLLDGLETPINADALWDNVQTELYPEKEKKFGWVWFSASSILAVILFSGYVYMSNTTASDQDVRLKDKVAQKAEITNKKKTAPSIVDNDNSTETNTTTKEGKIKSETTTIPENTITPKQVTKTNVAEQTENKIIETNSNLPKAQQDSKRAANKVKRTITASSGKEAKEIKTEGPQNNEANTLKTKTDGLQKSNAPIETKKEIPATKVIDDETKKLIIAAEEETKKNLEDPVLDTPEEDDGDNESLRKFKRNFQFGVGFRAGISNSLTTLSAKDEDDMQLRVLRSQSEKNLETIDLGLDVLIKHKSGLYLSAGLDYLKATRKLEFNSKVTTEAFVPGVSAIYVNPITMDTIREQGEVLQTTTTTKTKEVYNNLHLINIPVNLGVGFDYEQWTFGVQGGASLNVFVKQKGQVMIGEASFYDIGEDGENWFKDNLGVSFQGAALVGYNFTDNFQIVGGPSFRSPIIVSEDANPIKQSQVGLGFQVNARYWFD